MPVISVDAINEPGASGERRFEALFTEAPVSIQLLAPDGRTLRVNKAWEALWEVKDGDGVKEYVLSPAYNILEDPQLAAKGVTPLLRRAFAGETTRIEPILYDPAEIGRPGRARWVGATARPLHDREGRLTEVILIHEDVTEGRAAEQALRDSEQRLRLATDATNIGIWDWDIGKDIVTWTPEVYALHGVAPGGFGGTAKDFVERVHPDDVGALWSRVEQAIATKTGFGGDFRVVLDSGEDRWLHTSSRVYLGDEGALRMVGATFSIDRYKKAEAALLESDRRKDEFLAMLAHELRNPLAPIRSAAEILLHGPKEPKDIQRASEIIGRQVRHVTKLVDDLLDVSRVTRGLVELQREPVDLSTVIHGAFEQVSPAIESREHSLHSRIEAGGAWVLGDRARLVQVVVNLLTNAARYTPRGGRIEVTLRAEQGEAVLQVQDNGQGIERDLLPHVFELFTQGPRMLDRSQGGLGIGLALVRRLVELHGGTVEATSAGAGCGSTFTIRLARIAAGHSDLQHGAASPIDAAPHALHIVVVDDNRDAAETLQSLLENAGHRVEVHHDGTSAEAASSARSADVFILDIGLPDTDGNALAGRLQRVNRHALYVAMSGYGQPGDLEASRKAGFAHHLVKPVEWQDVEEVLGRLVRRTP